MRTPDVIRANRVRVRLTQAELARAIGVDTRQINRYETGETEPTLAVARRLAERLGISMDELAGEAAPLNGSGASAWHNLAAEATIRTGMVELTQQGHHLSVRGLRAQPETDADGELAWSAEMYVDGDSAFGGYKIDSAILSDRGLISLSRQGELLVGNWILLNLRGSATGPLCLARTTEAARERLQGLIAEAAS